MRRVRIYGTIGPACRNRAILRDMFREGMDGVRLNLSHTSLEEASEIIGTCRAAAADAGVEPELLIDMQGPEIRTGVTDGPLKLDEGKLTGIRDIPFPEEVMKALESAEPGQQILLDDGKILLETDASGSGRLRVVRGGVLESRKSVALPGVRICTPAMTGKDRAQIRNAKAFGVTAVMQPFVRGKDDLTEVRSALDEAGCSDILLFAKIESRAGTDRLEELIPHCDEIVIARGDLGNAMELWELPAAQKKIAALCRKEGRPFMVVTQMLDSMTHRQVPTRAEVSDIFNAVLDGASSVMVTGETAAGEYPALVIRYLVNTVREAERWKQQYADSTGGR